MPLYLYKSTTGRVVNAGNFAVSASTGIQTTSPVKELDQLVGSTLQRYTNGVLDTIDASGAATVTAARNITVADNDCLLKCTAGFTLTILNDALGGFTSAETAIIRTYQATSSAVTLAAGSGVTLRGTPKTAAQYVVQMIIRVGPNEWAYMT